MSATQYFPIPPEIFAHACGTVTKRVSCLPFLRNGITVTGEMVSVAMESLNAVPTRSLALLTPRESGSGMEDGLDRCIEERLHIPGKIAAPVIADVLCSAGITEPALIADRSVHAGRRGIRLVAPWTWHTGSAMAPSVRCGDAESGPNMSWMDLCPICHTGILDRVTGKQLFGIPRTDFYIECSHCGAKFIPVGPAYRLVSIATIRDPLWKKHLDKTYPPETWAALARGTGPGGNPSVRLPVKRIQSPVLPAPSLTLSPLKEGSLAVPLHGKTLYFRPVAIQYAGNVREDLFARIQKTLEEILRIPVFDHLRSPVNAKYSRYLPMKMGLFLSQLKERHDPFYREFLNSSGDEKYGAFRARDGKETEKKGVLIVVVNRGLYDMIDSPDPLGATINNRLGRIVPDDCLLNGDSARCRINALLCCHKNESGLFFYPAEREEERLSVTQALGEVIAVDRG